MNNILKRRPSWPEDVLLLARLAEKNQLKLMAIGGTTRDFLLSGHLPEDLDFELTSIQNFPNEKKWKEKVYQLVSEIRAELDWKVTECSFLVFKLETPNKITIEISSPRQEFFPSDKKNLGHSDFTVGLLDGSQIEICFQRRDLTINAIGLYILEGTWVDPFGGIIDLNNKILRACSDSFYLDPVRFLRLVRFEIQFQFKIEENLRSKIGQFNLEKLTPHYFFKESTKVPMLKFFKKLFEYGKEGVQYPTYINEILKINIKNFPESIFCKCFRNGLELIWTTIWLVDWSEEELKKFGKLFRTNQKETNDLINFFKAKEKAKELMNEERPIEWDDAKVLKNCHYIYLRNQNMFQNMLKDKLIGQDLYLFIIKILLPLGPKKLNPSIDQKKDLFKIGRPVNDLSVFVYYDFMAKARAKN